jgi:hypothetical protein
LLHEAAPLLKHVAAPIRLLDFIAMTWASAASTISFCNDVRSLAQVLNVARKAVHRKFVQTHSPQQHKK